MKHRDSSGEEPNRQPKFNIDCISTVAAEFMISKSGVILFTT